MPEDWNIDRDYEVLRDFATRVAQSAASPNHSDWITGLHLSGILTQHPAMPPADVPRLEGIAPALRGWLTKLPEKTPPGIMRDSLATLVALLRRARRARPGPTQRDVGIWRRESDSADAGFVRRVDRRGQWADWATVSRIGPKRGKGRVVLIGESVARGYFYDPGFNPASVLEAMLRPAQIDVVDLAKTNLDFEQLNRLIRESMVLAPDVVVVFAGNNWRPRIREQDIPLVASLLLRQGVPGMKAFLDARAKEQVAGLVSSANDFLKARDIRAIWLVPEFNLADWSDPLLPAPLLPGARNEEWNRLGERANLAWAGGELESAEILAREMYGLDGGASPLPLRMLAECCLARGDRSAARQYLEFCRDARGWDPSFSFSPRTSISIQNALRETAPGPGSVVIDLPEMFSLHLEGALPDRRLFLDYCHLTAEGISLAMAAVASKVMQLFTGGIVQPDALKAVVPAPEPKVEGRASFFAAVHNAHYFQSDDVVSYWCAHALRVWPECADIMRSFADFQTRRVPNIACESGLKLLDQREWSFLLSSKRLDSRLVDAITRSLAETGIDIAKEVSSLQLQEHGIRNSTRELTDFYYSSAVVTPSDRAFTSQSFVANHGSHALYAAAFWQQSKFIFLADCGHPIGLKLCYRVPGADGGNIKVEVNGNRVAEAAASEKWEKLEISIPASSINDGTNEIVLTWPGGQYSADRWLGAAADSIISGHLPRFHRVFGEIHTLVVYDRSGATSGESDPATELSLASAELRSP